MIKSTILACAAGALIPLAASAEEPSPPHGLLPQWELGAGATAFTLPDYRGSNESHAYLYPIPYFVYRGERVRVDRQGARALLLEANRVELDFSGLVTPPVDSSKNAARRGMPDLDPTIELGPQLNVIVARDRDWRLDLRFPVRAVVATDLRNTQGAGFTFYPHASLNAQPMWLGGKWNLGLNAGPLFGSADYHRYFYGVDPQFATAERPAYEAQGGYSGAVLIGSLTRRFGKTWVGAFVRYDNLRGAVFENSPLVKQDYALAGGIGIAWVFAESSLKVEGRQ